MTSSIRFTGLKFEICVKIRSSGFATAIAAQAVAKLVPHDPL